MSRYINAEWIRNIYADFEHYENRDDWTTPITNVLAVIDDAPSIDIVRCAECKCWLNDHICTHWSGYYGTIETIADDFCSYGEREDE